jgi:hypothetical protein
MLTQQTSTEEISTSRSATLDTVTSLWLIFNRCSRTVMIVGIV